MENPDNFVVYDQCEEVTEDKVDEDDDQTEHPTTIVKQRHNHGVMSREMQDTHEEPRECQAN